jgi:hypothetical protein
VQEIVDHLAGARVVMGVEGSHLCHALYAMAEGGGLCVLQPPNRFTCINKDFADCLGLRYAFLTGTEAAAGFRVEVKDLNRLLDKLERQLDVEGNSDWVYRKSEPAAVQAIRVREGRETIVS